MLQNTLLVYCTLYTDSA